MSSSGEDGDSFWPTLTRSSKVASVVVPVSRRIVYVDGVSVVGVAGTDAGLAGEAAEVMREEKIRGTFCIVPRRDSSSRLMVTRVPGGKGSGDGSVRFL